jgi:hypothetical protein
MFSGRITLNLRGLTYQANRWSHLLPDINIYFGIKHQLEI